jgi:polyhydroxyalkanoate synthesis regulator phasin
MATETTETENQATPAVEEAGVGGSPLADALGKVGLASIGALSLALESAEKLMKRLVARGEIDERKARRAFRELRQKRPHLPRPPHPMIAVGTGGLASKADIQALDERLVALAARVEHLNEGTLSGAPASTAEGAPAGAPEGTPAGV